MLLVVSVIFILAIFNFGFNENFSKQTLVDLLNQTKDFTNSHMLISWLLFISAYIIVAAFFTPGMWLMNVVAGYLYGLVAGLIGVNLGAIIGSVAMFLIAKRFLSLYVVEHYGEKFKKFAKMYKKNGANFLLFLRLLPGFSALLINIFAGATKSKLKTFIWTTSLGLLPAELVFVYAGRQGRLVNSAESILTPEIIVVFILLGLFSLIPILIKRNRGDYENI